MTCAFPVLFPTGAADFSASRPRTVTIGYYFKHLLMYRDGRFARHPRFRYFALNTEMRHRALGAGQIYVKQNTTDAQLTVQELRDMVSVGWEAFSRRVLHYATSLRGTRSYWFKQRSRLISMIDTLGLPTVLAQYAVIKPSQSTVHQGLSHRQCEHVYKIIKRYTSVITSISWQVMTEFNYTRSFKGDVATAW